MLRHAGVAACAVAVLGAWTANASAGTYTVLSCKDRAGARAPIDDAGGGWVPGSTGGLGLDSRDYCDSPSRGLVATVSGPWSHPVGSMAWWRFVPPAGTLVEGADVLYSGYTLPYNGSNRGIVAFSGATAGEMGHDWGAGPLAPRWFRVRGMHDAWLQATAQCDGPLGSPDCPAGTEHATLEILRSEVLLSDTSPPSAGRATGSAVSFTTWQGVHVFAFPAGDEGSGVYQAIVEVDGAPTLVRTVNDWGGRCVDTTAGGRVFRYPRPCLTSVDALVAVDAGRLPAGDHDVALQVTDAAGNVRTVYSARKRIVAPQPSTGPGGEPAPRGPTNAEHGSDPARLRVRWVGTRRATLTAPFGRRHVIRGRLTTAAGSAIRGARIELRTAIDGRPGPPIDKGGARTRRDGRFTLILPANASSRTLVLRYRTLTGTLRLRVRAGVGLRVAGVGRRAFRISGWLAGRPLPSTGKVVELQARSPGRRWITFRTLRASRTGRFATRYTFRRGGPALYLMRARVRAGDDYPYATGSSHAVRVRVR